MRSLLRFLATFGPVGYAPMAPATAGSAVVALIGWFLPVPSAALALALIAVGAAVAVWIAGEAEKDLGHDARPIVIDEAVGQSLALLFVPHAVGDLRAGPHVVELDREISRLATGVYMVRLRQGPRVAATKICVVR